MEEGESAGRVRGRKGILSRDCRDTIKTNSELKKDQREREKGHTVKLKDSKPQLPSAL